MATPTQRHTSSRKNRRRSYHALKKADLSTCSKCKEPIIPHNVCLSCGHYKGREIINVLSKIDKKNKKRKLKK